MLLQAIFINGNECQAVFEYVHDNPDDSELLNRRLKRTAPKTKVRMEPTCQTRRGKAEARNRVGTAVGLKGNEWRGETKKKTGQLG